MKNENESEWLTSAEACRILGVSDRTLKRRIEAGVVESRLETLPRGGVRRVVRVTERAGQEQEASGPNVRATNERENGSVRDNADNRAGRAGQIERATRGPEVESAVVPTPQVERLEKEVDFLRGLVEQHQRAEAELRASLREVLRAMPRQLTEGTGAAPEAAQNRPQIAATSNTSTDAQAPAESPAKAKGAASRRGPRAMWKLLLGIR
jgi:hypothetical protein